MSSKELTQIESEEDGNDPLMVLVEAATEEDNSTHFNAGEDNQALEAYILESQLEIRNIVTCHEEIEEEEGLLCLTDEPSESAIDSSRPKGKRSFQDMDRNLLVQAQHEPQSNNEMSDNLHGKSVATAPGSKAQRKSISNPSRSHSNSPLVAQEFPTTQHCSRHEVREAIETANLSRSIFISESSSGTPSNESIDLDIVRDSTDSEDNHSISLTQEKQITMEVLTSDTKFQEKQATGTEYQVESSGIDGSRHGRIFRMRGKPPSQVEVNKSIGCIDILPILHERVHYSNPNDASDQDAVMAGRRFHIPACAVSDLPAFSSKDGEENARCDGNYSQNIPEMQKTMDTSEHTLWAPRIKPPTANEVSIWMTAHALTFKPSQTEPTSQDGLIDLTLSVSSQVTETSGPNTPADRPERPPSPKYDEPCFYNVHSEESAHEHPLGHYSKQTPQPSKVSILSNANFRISEQVKEVKSDPIASTNGTHVGIFGTSQITPPTVKRVSEATPVSQAGFNQRIDGGQHLVLLSIEIHCDCRGTLLPDPRYDSVRCIVMVSVGDADNIPAISLPTHVILWGVEESKVEYDAISATENCTFKSFSGEKELLQGFIDSVIDLDPDILIGFELQKDSLGYLVDRAKVFEINLLRLMSRIPQLGSIKEFQEDEYGKAHATGYHCTGRILLNLWRILRGELTLGIYTFENCAKSVLKIRVPFIHHSTLSSWFHGGHTGGRWRCIKYFIQRTQLNVKMVDQIDLIGRTSEMARTYGIDFFSVIARGSQYRVEGMLARLAHTQNFLLISPSKEQVFKQPGMECLPLVMEPESRFYTAPVVVLDFQSLYPSIIIAYNLCYSTCVGRPTHIGPKSQASKLGVTQFSMPAELLIGEMAPDKLEIMPNLVSYAGPRARPGVLPRLLHEILMTRIMIKERMKKTPKSAKILQRCLNARQYGLKMIANVTYGYTGAGFSGRMPFAELADSIVQASRETLQNAIRLVEDHPNWNAKVKYGDTDSMFVLLEGRTREEAFRIGKEIAAAVTSANPKPIELKLEKVYQPCILQTKKRYVGFSYESPDQAVPFFDAKGIETVRRDACPAVAKILEKVIQMLFTTCDLSLVKSHLCRTWTKILSGRVSLQDFIFAKEVRLGSYSSKSSTIPPAAVVAAKAMTRDPRAEPLHAARVPYVIVCGAPGARLVDMVVDPHAMIESYGRYRLHALYYITKQINPAVDRILSLVGVDVATWFSALPKPQRLLPQKRINQLLQVADTKQKGRGTIDAYYLSRHCAVCDQLTYASQILCEKCGDDPQTALAVIMSRFSELEQQMLHLRSICLHCGGGGGPSPHADERIVCQSLDCSVFFERKKVCAECAVSKLQAISACNMF